MKNLTIRYYAATGIIVVLGQNYKEYCFAVRIKENESQ